MTECEGKKTEEAVKNAKTDQERMELAMQYSQQVNQKMMNGGGPESMLPKLVINVPDVTVDPNSGGILLGNVKYDEIVINMHSRLEDMHGKTIMALKPEFAGGNNLFVSTSNARSASYNYGTLTFSDNTSLSDLFNPYLLKTDGKVFLAYNYSPKKNAIMQCKIPW
jgi:hypothetical protein